MTSETRKAARNVGAIKHTTEGEHKKFYINAFEMSRGGVKKGANAGPFNF